MLITIDYEQQKLYWLTIESSGELGSMSTDGTNQMNIATWYSLFYTFMSVFSESALYFYDLDFLTYDVVLDTEEVLYDIQSCHQITDSKVIKPQIQGIFIQHFSIFYMTLSIIRTTFLAINPCGLNNGGCSDLCLLSAVDSRNYTCACHFTTTLLPNMQDCSSNNY